MNESDTLARRAAAQQRRERDIAAYTRDLEHEPSQVEIYLHRAEAYYTGGDYAAAIADYTTAIALQPSNAKLYALRADLYLEEDRIAGAESALADYNKAIALDPAYLYAYQARADIYWQEQERNKAAAEHSPQNYELAIASYTQALNLAANQQATEYLSARGYAHMMLGHTAEAIADFQQVLQISTDESQRKYAAEQLANLLPPE